MKHRFISLFVVLVMLFSMIPFSGAASLASNEFQIMDLGDGFTAEITSTTMHLRSSSAEHVKNAIVKYNGTRIGSFILYGYFTYNGSSAQATGDDWEATASRGYDYDGQSSHSDATVKGSCTFSGNGINKTVSLKITCDKDGNLS